MLNLIFIFDFDGTLTCDESIPYIAKHFSEHKDKILDLTEKTINGYVPFEEGFRARVNLLKNLDKSEVSNLLSTIPVHINLLSFINNNKLNTHIATGNLDVWINQALDKYNCHKHTSIAEIGNSGEVLGVKTILNKYELVKQLRSQGKFVVYIGDGNNDSMAMEASDISIGAGLVHHPADSVLEVADYAVYSENALLLLLNQIYSFFSKLQYNKNYSVLLCAGTGSRLGLSVTKALIKINETMLIQYHLNRLSADFDLVFVVVGFQLKEVIINSKDYWENIVYVINHSYSSKGPGHSLFLAVKYINNSIFVLDCDLIISRKSYLECLRLKHEFLGVSENRSNNPITVKLNNDKVISFDKSFSDSVTFEIERKDLEWTGPLNIHSSKIKSTDGQIFELLENLLPMSMFKVNAFDIDTMSDYVYAQQVFRNYQ